VLTAAFITLSSGLEQTSHAGPVQDDRDPMLPRYRLSDIRKHDARSEAPWVTWGDKVYDITEWIEAHPGGDVILRAAGGSIDPYWDIFTIHKAPHVYEILSQYLIGYVDAADLLDGKPRAERIQDPFDQDPVRDERLLTHTAKPRNAEPPAGELCRDFTTPNELFFVRNHMWVPAVADGEAEDHQLTVELPDGETRTYTLGELRSRFPTHKITASLQCSGNRRGDMTRHAGDTNGLQWGVGAMSNATWEGVKLADVLADAGLDPSVRAASPGSGGDGDGEMHVQFSGLEAYGASIPLCKALDPHGDVLLAFAMNGAPLPRDHGFPLRAVVPGHVAARSVKWLTRVAVADEESPTQWQRRDYKCFGPNEGTPDSDDWARYPAIQEMPVTSAVTRVWLGDDGLRRAALPWAEALLRRRRQPRHDNDNDEGRRAEPGVKDPRAWQAAHAAELGDATAAPVAVAGYAYSGGGRAVARVDVSLDGGRTWDQAELVPDRAGGSRRWAWTRWRYAGRLLPSAADGGGGRSGPGRCAEIVVKATDEAYNTQPEHQSSVYNVRGNLATGWHRVRVRSTGEKDEGGRLIWTTEHGGGGGGGAGGATKPEKKTGVSGAL